MTSKPYVLVVEDEEDSRESLRDVLELEGYHVETAANGKEGLAKIQALGGAACVVLLDLFMPVMTGIEMLEQLRATGGLEGLKVLITTSAPENAPPGVPVLKKPIDLDKLLPVVADLCAA